MIPEMSQVDEESPYLKAEGRARVKIDLRLKASGFAGADYQTMNLYARKGVAVREFRMAAGHGTSDYLLFKDAHAVGVAEAKKQGKRYPRSRPKRASTAWASLRTWKPHAGPFPSCTRPQITRSNSPICSIPSPAAVEYSASIGRRQWPGGSVKPELNPAAPRT